jgi:hypothetical protein
LICSNCKTDNTESAAFCNSCGVPIRNISKPPASQTPKAPFNWRENKGLLGTIAGATLLVLVIVGINASIAPPATPDNTSFAKTIMVKDLPKTGSPVCSDLSKVIKDEKDKALKVKRTKALLVGTTAPRQAATYLARNNWVNGGSSKAEFEARVSGISDPTLREVLSSKTAQLPADNQTLFSVAWNAEFKTSIIKSCGLQSDYVAHIEYLISYDDAVSNLLAVAASVPWYPDGFTVWSDDANLAFKYGSGACKSYATEGCWHIKIASRLGCKSDLYAELNEMDSSGSVVGFTNATIGYLAAGQIANLEFDVLTPGVHNGVLSKINCF